jgi:hypothetical protein
MNAVRGSTAGIFRIKTSGYSGTALLRSETRQRNRRRLAFIAPAPSLVLVPFKEPCGPLPHHCLGWSHTRSCDRSLAGSTGLGM